MTADEVLDALRSSRRPAGVPDEVETDAIAAAIADALWTVDGRPWEAVSTSASCAGGACTVEIVGTRTDADGEDLWRLEVVPATADVTVAEADVGAVPAAVGRRLDEQVREVAPASLIGDLVLARVRWLPPPEGGFRLSYRDGGEVSGCSVDVVVSPDGDEILDSSVRDC